MSMEHIPKKLIRSKSGLRIVTVDEHFRSPFLLCEPQWIPDKEGIICTRCGVRFGFTIRRHHCRRCGLIYCGSCSNQKLELPRMCFIDPVRICDNCIPATIEENKFFGEQIKTLTNGATFILACVWESEQMVLSTDVFQCKLSSDHRHLIFDGVKLSPLDITSIKALRVDKDYINGVKGAEIEYNNCGKSASIRLDTTPELEHRKSGISWIAAMHQAFKMLQTDSLSEG